MTRPHSRRSGGYGRQERNEQLHRRAGELHLILAVGTNTTETQPILSLRVKKAILKGAKLIVVDPHKIELVGLAHRWLPLNISTDIPLFNAIAHVILEEDLYDKEYVAARTEGIEELRQFLKTYTPEHAEELTGVQSEEIVAAAREYANADRASIIYTLGVTEHSSGVHNVRALSNLTLLCGNFGVRSALVNPLLGQNNVHGAGDMGRLPAYMPGSVLG